MQILFIRTIGAAGCVDFGSEIYIRNSVEHGGDLYVMGVGEFSSLFLYSIVFVAVFGVTFSNGNVQQFLFSICSGIGMSICLTM